jgi:hypothetical protein
MDDRLRRHCDELNRCNQRGGRMLSIFDLLEAETLDLDLAAFLMERINRGASFMVGARPGGAGKTTVMCALLNLIPASCGLIAATAATVRAAGTKTADGGARQCYVCHEIGPGPYFSYLWGRELRAYCALQEKGHLLATNLHADDLDETREQVCTENGVPPAHFQGFNVLVFLRTRGGYSAGRRWIERVYASDGRSPHRPVFAPRTGVDAVQHARVQACRIFLEQGLRSGLRTLEETRSALLQFSLPETPAPRRG